MESEYIPGSIVSAIVKCVFLICISLVFGFWINSCGLKKEVIEECQNACHSSSSKMESVTSQKCVCYKQDDGPWVIKN